MLATSARAATYHVSPDGNDANPGTAGAPFATAGKATSVAAAGDEILLRRGGSWDETVALDADGTAAVRLSLGAYGEGDPPIVFGLTVGGDHVAVRDLVVDHGRQAGDAVRIRSARNVSLVNLEIRDGAQDGIDADKADGLLVEATEIHHFLAGSFSVQADAHGIVTTDTSDLVLRDVDIHHVSGDCFQTDPDRDANTPDNILVEDSRLWTGPLAADFNAWNAGEVPGENAIDTKMVKSNWDGVARMRITVRNVEAFGWMPGYIGNRAAFNMKEKIEALFDGVTVHDNELAFRIRGTRGNANVTIMNAVIYGNDYAIRAEDSLSDLVVYNSTFGEARERHVRIVAGDDSGSWDLKNNAFLDALPAVAAHASNRIAVDQDFVAAGSHDFRLTPASALLDAGLALAVVTHDRDGTQRPQGGGYDVGAFERVVAAPHVPVELLLPLILDVLRD